MATAPGRYLSERRKKHSVLIKRVFDYRFGAKLLSLKRKSATDEEAVAFELIKPRAFH